MTAGQWTASRASLTLSTRPILRPTVQTCIVHLVRCRGFRGPTGATVPSNSLNVCGWKDSKVVAKDLKRIYRAIDDVEAEKALADFEAEWGQKYPSIAPS
jgi:putative transposase